VTSIQIAHHMYVTYHHQILFTGQQINETYINTYIQDVRFLLWHSKTTIVPLKCKIHIDQNDVHAIETYVEENLISFNTFIYASNGCKEKGFQQ